MSNEILKTLQNGHFLKSSESETRLVAIMPRVLSDAVGLTPMVVLVSVASVGILFGGFAVILAIPLAAVLATLIDVILRKRDPAEEEVPAVLFSAGDSET